MKKVFAALLALLISTSGAPAFAHAELTSANPKANAVLKKAPLEIKLTFDDDLISLKESNQIEVTNSKKIRVDKNDTKVLGNQITTSLKTLAPGKYQVAFRVLSADGHPVASKYSFTIKK